jgi:CHAT domain-containing protein
VGKCDSFFNFKNQRNSPLPDDLARCLEDAVSTLKQAGPSYTFDYALTLFYHANQMGNTGYLRKAVSEFQAVDSMIQLAPETFPPGASGHTNIQLSILYQQLYEMDKALVCGEKALAEYHSLKMHEDEFNALVNRGVIALAKGNAKEGQHWAEKALAQWNTIPAVPASQRLNRLSAENLKYACLIDLADSLAAEQGQQAAQPQYRAALNGLREVLHEAAAFDTLTQDVKVATGSLTANIQSCFSNLRASEPAWADSILRYYRLLSEKEVTADNAKSYFGLAQAYAALAHAEKKQWEDAYALSVKSCQHYGHPMHDIFDRTPVRAEQVEQKQNLANALRMQAKVLQKRKGNRKAQEQALFVYDNSFALLDELRLQFASESSMELSTERFIRLYHEAAMAAIELHRQTGDSAYFEKAFQYAEQGKSFTLRNALRRQMNNPARATEEKKRLADVRDAELLYQKNPATLGDLEKAYRALQTWRGQIKQNDPGYFAEQISEEAVGLGFLRQKLVNNDTTALIEFSSGDDSTLMLVVTSKAQFSLNIPHPADWAQTLDLYTQSIQNGNTDFKSAGFQIYETLLKKVLEQRLPRSVKRLILVPDRQLRKVIFEGLPTRRAEANMFYGDIQYLLLSYHISYQYSLTSFKYSDQIKREQPSYKLGVFISKYEGGQSSSLRCSEQALENLEKSVRNIAQAEGEQAKVFEPAWESEFKQECYKFDELLFAMHGCLDLHNPLESSVLFTRKTGIEDDRLTVREVLGFQRNLNARLAVFASCMTGSGPLLGGEGIISLARAFAYAGVPATISATAEVDEAETASLLESLHEHLRNRASKDWALAEAKREFVRKNAKKHPFFWANLILIGDPAPMGKK